MKGSTHSVQLEGEPSHAEHSELQVSQISVSEFAYFPFGQLDTQLVPSKNVPGWQVSHSVFDPSTQVRQLGSQLMHKFRVESSVYPEGQFKRH